MHTESPFRVCFRTADAPTCGRLAAALGVPRAAVGTAVRVVLLAANLEVHAFYRDMLHKELLS